MGWDAFGLPAENAALKNNTPPREWTLGNIAAMKRQMERLGLGYDWATELTTCLPDYYRWNQWFFLRMYENGLAYRKKSKVNWCPECATVLANEQVVDGCCWRHESTKVEQRDLVQWFLRITAYAEELLDGLDKLDGWPDKVCTMQRNWIGRSEGTEVDFFLEDVEVEESERKRIRVFTTRVDTIFGATSMQLAPQHELVAEITSANPELRAKVDELLDQQQRARDAGDLGEIEKHGVPTGRFAVNPYNGERVPIWVANYILADYGTGAIMSVPAHDERDFEFATKYGLEIRRVIQPVEESLQRAARELRVDRGLNWRPGGERIDGGLSLRVVALAAEPETILLVDPYGLAAGPVGRQTLEQAYGRGEDLDGSFTVADTAITERPAADSGEVGLFQVLPTFAQPRLGLLQQLIHGKARVRPFSLDLLLNDREVPFEVPGIAAVINAPAEGVDFCRHAGSETQVPFPGRFGNRAHQVQVEQALPAGVGQPRFAEHRDQVQAQ
jgi:leucyl-tRNA synthetase